MNGWILRNSTNQTLRSNSDTKTGREKIFPVFFFYITDNQLSLRSCHRHIKKPAFFFYFFVGSCFLVWAASLICFNHKYGIKFKSLCSMHCHQVYPFFFSVFLILFFQHFSITFNMFKPFFLWCHTPWSSARFLRALQKDLPKKSFCMLHIPSGTHHIPCVSVYIEWLHTVSCHRSSSCPIPADRFCQPSSLYPR